MDATDADSGPTIKLNIEFGGGMELLFSHQHNHTITIPRYYDPSLALISPSTSSPTPPKEAPRPSEGRPTDIKFLIWWLKNYLMDDKDRPELFVQGETIRPGILILINSTDWELEGELEYELQDGDEVVFISTLHGG